jgi:predicted nucleotidyltransferase
MKNVIDIEYLKKNNLIIFECVAGSHAYGTNLPTSDTDIRGIFIQPFENLLGFGKIDQVSDEKNDIIYYEIERFLDLLKSNNPNILELVNMPPDCVKICDYSFMSLIFEHLDKFLTKKCRWSFGGYAVEQIKKARGLNKKMNWEENEMVRKTVLDFCYVLQDAGSMSVKDWIIGKVPKKTWVSQKSFGLSAIDHGHDLYAMFYNSDPVWGIVSNEETANDVQLTSVPKGKPVVGYLYFNKDGYSSHCKKFKEYQEWLTNRNETRVNMAKAHGKKFDGKNLAHCLRLLNVANEIAEGKGLNVRRSPEEIKKLIAIRKGEYEYEDILAEAESLIEKMDKAFEESNLPDKVDGELINDLLIKIRKQRYGL